jgi:hypothetical protein
MVINTQYRFIFVHVPKTAGTSVAKSLPGLDGNHTNWLASTKHETLAEFNSAIRGRQGKADEFQNHSLNSYFRFAFVRNPWDRMLSFYRFLVEQRPKREIESVTSFRDFLIQAERGVKWIQALYSMRPRVDYFTLAGGRLSLDFLGHFEHLQEDIRAIGSRIGHRIELPHINRSSNSEQDFREHYDGQTIELVANRFTDDIRHFGYTFDQKNPTKRCSASLQRQR